jgi:hypothetical protein
VNGEGGQEKEDAMKLGLLCLLISSLAMAQTGTISGRVVDENGDGIVGATVRFVDFWQGVSVLPETNGEYTLGNAPCGTHSVRVDAIGYETRVFDEVIIARDSITILNVVLSEPTLSPDELKMVVPGRTIGKAVYSGTISGRVVDENGDGVLGAAIKDVESGRGVEVKDPNGNYELRGVLTGVHKLQIFAIGYEELKFDSLIVNPEQPTILNVILKEMPIQGPYCPVKIIHKQP